MPDQIKHKIQAILKAIKIARRKKKKIARRNINNLRYADDTSLVAESKGKLMNLLMKVKEEREKAGLKFNIQKTKIMAYSCITSRLIDGKQWKQ